MQKRPLLHVSHNHWRAIMQNDSNAETAQAEIPAYLQCEPRTFKVKLNHWLDRNGAPAK